MFRTGQCRQVEIVRDLATELSFQQAVEHVGLCDLRVEVVPELAMARRERGGKTIRLVAWGSATCLYDHMLIYDRCHPDFDVGVRVWRWAAYSSL